MVRPAVVLHRILNELEAGKTDRVEGEMIRSAGIANGQRRHAEVLEWLHPRLKHGRDGFVALQVDASNCTGAVIDVEVAREFRVVGF